MVKIRDIVIDCADAAALARFWAGVLDGYDVRPYDDEEIARLAELGYTPETDPGVAVDGPGPTLFFQQVPEPKIAKNRIHFDVMGGDRSEEVAKLVASGASIAEEFDGWTIMRDPEGNEFCVLDPE